MNIKIYVIKYFKTDFIISNSIICKCDIHFIINDIMYINNKLLFIKYTDNKTVNYIQMLLKNINNLYNKLTRFSTFLKAHLNTNLILNLIFKLMSQFVYKKSLNRVISNFN